MTKVYKAVPWALAAYIAYIFIFYLQYKFTGHEGSQYVFVILTDWLGFSGYEAWMRIGVGAAELVAAILLFVPATQIFGAALAVGIMTGAIFFHLVSPLGIDPYHDGGVLFKEACAVWLSGALILAIRRDKLSAISSQLSALNYAFKL